MSVAYRVIAVAAVAVLVGVVIIPAPASGQRGGPEAQDPNLPGEPTAVAIPAITAEVTGPGPVFESVHSLPPGMDLAHFKYEAREYFVSGTANRQPYKTRMVVRKPSNNADFSGLVMTEAMHPSGHTAMFEYTSTYFMNSGHISVEVVTGGLEQLVDHNRERYGDIRVEPAQVSEILAQVGAAIRSNHGTSPLAGLPLRKMVLAGTSATAGVLIRYLPGHMVYRTPDMQRIYDGFLPHANGSTIRQVDVPLIQVPTMTEVMRGNVTARQDSDAPGDQYRLYEFSGMAHVDSRNNVRFQPNPCKDPVSEFPLQAYVSVALHHLFQWVDKGVLPPRADRTLVDRNEANDGSVMALDEHGNPVGGIRNPYVDVPTAKYGVPNEAVAPLIPNAAPYIRARGQAGANQMCRLGGSQIAFSQEKLKQLYKDTQTYRTRVETRLDELEQAGWSLPVYRDMILAGAAKVDF